MPKLTVEYFLNLLPIVVRNREWSRPEGDYSPIRYSPIRSDRGECPLCAIVNEIMGTSYGYNVGMASRDIGWVDEDRVVGFIVDAADWKKPSSEFNPRAAEFFILRSQMITILEAKVKD